MLKYEAGFSVLKFDGKSRNCSKGLYFEDVKSLLSAGMNPCDYAYTSEVINKLKRLLSEEICEFEWGGGERTWFLSEPELTLVTDNFVYDFFFETVNLTEVCKGEGAGAICTTSLPLQDNSAT